MDGKQTSMGDRILSERGWGLHVGDDSVSVDESPGASGPYPPGAGHRHGPVRRHGLGHYPN